MSVDEHQHKHTCDCAAHHHRGASPNSASLWAALPAVIACAVCPACLTTYAKLLSVFGMGYGLSEWHHQVLLSVALCVSVLLSAWRSFRSGRAWPLGAALTGATLVALGHVLGELHWLEWTGIGVLLAGGLWEHVRFVRHAAAHANA